MRILLESNKFIGPKFMRVSCITSDIVCCNQLLSFEEIRIWLKAAKLHNFCFDTSLYAYSWFIFSLCAFDCILTYFNGFSELHRFVLYIYAFGSDFHVGPSSIPNWSYNMQMRRFINLVVFLIDQLCFI